MTHSAIWLKCPECSHVWAPVKLPMEAVAACTALMKAFCPNCGNDSPKMAGAADIPSAQQENDMSDTTREPGPYTLHKADPCKPRRPHKTYEHAETEAHRLAGLNPGIEYIINREVGRVKVDG